MKSLIEVIREAESKKVAIGHFNISDLAALKAIFGAARALGVPVIIGVSEGEREFIGVRQAAALIKSLREEYDYPIYLNADHTHSLEKAKEAVEAGFDAIVFDASKLPFEENMKQTKEAVAYTKSTRPDVLVEGELGYIGSGSQIFTEIPEGAAMKPEDLAKPEEAARFVRETGVDLLAPAVGNLHGMMADAPNPALDIGRIAEIKKAVGVPLVLHGGSGITDDDFRSSIKAGISIIHINTEIRVAWRRGLEKAFLEKPEEIVPYKLLPGAVAEIKEVAGKRLRLFNRLV